MATLTFGDSPLFKTAVSVMQGHGNFLCIVIVLVKNFACMFMLLYRKWDLDC